MARFIETLDDVLHDVDGTRQREVGWTMESVSVGLVSGLLGSDWPIPAVPDLNPSLRTDVAVMPADRVLSAGDPVVVTGAIGFVGRRWPVPYRRVAPRWWRWWSRAPTTVTSGISTRVA